MMCRTTGGGSQEFVVPLLASGLFWMDPDRLCDHAVWRLSRSLAATPELFISNLNLATMNLSYAHLQVLANGLDRRYREGQMGTIDLHGNPCLTRQQNSDEEENVDGLRMFLGSVSKIEELKLEHLE